METVYFILKILGFIVGGTIAAIAILIFLIWLGDDSDGGGGDYCGW